MGHASPKPSSASGGSQSCKTGAMRLPPAFGVRQLGLRALLIAGLFLLSLVALLYISANADRMAHSTGEHWHGGANPIAPLLQASVPTAASAAGKPCTESITDADDAGFCAIAPPVSDAVAAKVASSTAFKATATGVVLVTVPTPTAVLPPGTEDVHALGHADLPSYMDELRTFITLAYPKAQQSEALRLLDAHSNGSSPSIPHSLWQSSAVTQSNLTAFEHSWAHTIANGTQMESWAAAQLKPSTMYAYWSTLSRVASLRTSIWSYLVLALPQYGGIYSSLHHDKLRPFSHWDANATHWSVNAPASAVANRPSLILSIANDVGSSSQWTRFSARPLQFTPTTIASGAGHPILVDTLRRLNVSAALVAKASKAREQRVADLLSEAKHLEGADDLVGEELKVEAEAVRSRPLVESAVRATPDMLVETEIAGAALFTDAVLSYLRARYGVMWTSLRELKGPVRIGEVAILPMRALTV